MSFSEIISKYSPYIWLLLVFATMHAKLKDIEVKLEQERTISKAEINTTQSLILVSRLKEFGGAGTKEKLSVPVQERDSSLENYTEPCSKQCSGLPEKLAVEFEAKLANLTEKFEAKLANLTEKYEAKLANLTEKYEVKLANLTEKFEVKLANLTEKYEAKLANLTEKYEAKLATLQEELEATLTAKEKAKNKTVSKNIVCLRVGEKKTTTVRSTLCQVKDSLLASMFCGEYEGSLNFDQDGCVLLDYNANHFFTILEFLHESAIGIRMERDLSKVAPDDEIEKLWGLAAHLGLDELLGNMDTFGLHTDGFTIRNNGATAVYSSNDQDAEKYEYVLGKNAYNRGVIRWKLKIESYYVDPVMFVGIVDVAKKMITWDVWWASPWRGSYGIQFTAYENSIIWKDMKKLSWRQYNWSPGDLIEVILNCNIAKLTIIFPDAPPCVIGIPRDTIWQLHLCVFGKNCVLSIV